jgi:hypothetical protein
LLWVWFSAKGDTGLMIACVRYSLKTGNWACFQAPRNAGQLPLVVV